MTFHLAGDASLRNDEGFGGCAVCELPRAEVRAKAKSVIEAHSKKESFQQGAKDSGSESRSEIAEFPCKLHIIYM